MSKLSSTSRVITMLKYLNEGKKLDLNSLSYEFDVSIRTIQRDIELIKDIFDNDFLKKDGSLYFTVEKNILSNVLKGTDLATLMHILTLFDISGSKLKIDDNLKNILKETQSIYHFNNKPFEYLTNYKILEKLERAIKFKQEIKLDYKTLKGIKTFKLKPYKITLLNENFYLLGMDDNGRFVFSRVNLIKNIEVLSKTFYHIPEVNKFIKEIQTPWSKIDRTQFTVIIKTKPDVSKYFKMKNFFNSQKIKEELETGELIIEYKFTCFQEVEEFLIKWLPNVQILEPSTLKTHMKEILIKKLESLD